MSVLIPLVPKPSASSCHLNDDVDDGDDDDGSFLACEDLGKRFISRLRFISFNLKRRSDHFFGQDQSTVVQRAETTVAVCSETSCV